MRVLAITLRADIGGGPEHLYQLTKAYGDAARVIIACPDDAPYDARYRALDNVEQVVQIPHRAFQLRHLMRLRRLVRQGKCDVIHSHGKGAGIYGRLLSAITRVPCVHTFHGLHVGEYGRAKRAVYLGIEHVLGWFTKAAICVSDGEAAQIDAAGFLPVSKRHVIANGVVVPDDVPARTLDPKHIKIAAVSRFDHQKNPDLLIDIAARLKDRIGSGFTLRVMGQGEQSCAIAQRLRDAGLQDVVTLMGPTDSPRDVLRQHDLFLSTSRWEGMPLAVLEAMSEGLVPVVSDVVGNRDVVMQGETGWLYPLDDPDAGAQAIMGAVAQWQVMRAKAHAAVARDYSVARMAEETLQLTKSVL